MWQGFDKYGVWRVDALPTPNLREAVHLKVGVPCTLPPANSTAWAALGTAHVKILLLEGMQLEALACYAVNTCATAGQLP